MNLLLVSISLAVPLAAQPGWAQRSGGPDPALQQYLSANGLLNRGLYELAAAEYRQFLSSHDDHEKAPVAHYGLAVCLFRTKQYDAAVEELRPLHERSRFAFAAEVGTMLGQCHLSMKRHGDAARVFQQVLRKQSDHALADDAGAGRVEALYLDGQYTETVEACKYFAQKWSDSPLRQRSEFFGGLASMALREYSDAADRFAELLDDYSDGPFAEQTSLLLAQCYQQDNVVDKAIRQYRRVLEQAQSRYLPDALLGLGTLLRQGGNPDEAGTHLDRLLRRHSESPLVARAHFQRGRAWFDQERYDRAFEQFEHAVEDESLADEANYWMAKCKLRQDDFDAAAERLGDAIEHFPESDLAAEMSYDRAIALVRANDHDAAIDALRAFRSRFPDHELAAEALQLLALTRHQQGEFDQSRDHCEEFLSRHGSHALAPSVAFLAAENEFLDTDYEAAAEGFRRFLARHGDDSQATKAKFRLGTALYRLAKYDDAGEFLKEVTDGGDTKSVYRSALLALGDMAFQRSEWKNAQQHLSDYLSGGGDIPSADEALLKLALCLARQDRHEDALRVYDRLIAGFGDSPHRIQAVFERGQALVALERFDDAETAFEAVVSEGGDSQFKPYALNHLANLATRKQDFDAAAKLYARTAQSASAEGMNAEAMFQNAQVLIASKRFKEAEQAFERFVDEYPSHQHAPEARARWAIAIARQDRHEDAVNAIERVERDAGSSLEAELLTALRYEKAWCLRELGRADEATRAYAVLLGDSATGEFNVHAMLELSGIHVAAARYEEAAKVLRRLRGAMQSDSVKVPAEVREQATYRLGVCEFELGRWREAAELFEEFVDDFGESDLLASASFFAGEALFKLGRFERAVLHLERVAERFEEDAVYAPSLLRLGESLASVKRWPRSERVFSDYLERFSDSEHWYQARFGIGWARENQQRHDEAISAYRDVVARHQGPTAARSQFQIGECLFAKRAYDEAVRELLKVDILYAYPEWSAAALFEAGRCFEKLGKTVEARSHFQQVSERFEQTRWASLASQRLSELSTAMMPGR